jgi:hypothetical protein
MNETHHHKRRQPSVSPRRFRFAHRTDAGDDRCSPRRERTYTDRHAEVCAATRRVRDTTLTMRKAAVRSECRRERRPVSQRLFTVHEANALIPKLELLMGKLQRHGATLSAQIDEIAHAIGQPPEAVTAAQLLELRPELSPVIDELETLLGEIDACGGQLKGLDLGLVDFLTEINGEVVLLCWQYGEKEIAYYHSLETGFSGRKPLNQPTTRARYLQ